MNDFIESVEIKITPSISYGEYPARYDIDNAVYEYDQKVKGMSSQADVVDYMVAAASGLLCGMLDIFWVGKFDLTRGRQIASNQIDNFVKKTAKLLGCKDDDLKKSVKFLENGFKKKGSEIKGFKIPSDGNASNFGGGLQHHLRDFAHHPTIVGLIFSLLTQFTGLSYGTDVNGCFKVYPVLEKSKKFIGKDIPDKIFKGTIVWFFHLVSDMAGSSATAGLTGGTGIPGPILSLAKELSALPIFKNMKIKGIPMSEFLSRLFNGTLLAKHDENGRIIKDTIVKFDLRGELGVLVEIGRQAVPVIANECIVRGFYFIRRLFMEAKAKQVCSLSDFSKIDWDKVKPYKNATVTRMLTIATGVFTLTDITEAVVTKKFWVAINYVGVARFAVAIGAEIAQYYKIRDVKKIKEMYETIERNTYTESDNEAYNYICEFMS